MNIGRWYLRQNDTLAAINRFKTVVDRYQTTSDAPEALYRLVEANLQLGLLDEAKKDGSVLGYNYPGDQWYIDAYNLLTSKGLRPQIIPAVSSKRSVFHPEFTKDKSTTIAPPQTTAQMAAAKTTPVKTPVTAAKDDDVTPVKKTSGGGWFHIPFIHSGQPTVEGPSPDPTPTPTPGPGQD
jgi:outer membrane protein assembly factor BamD